jgi:hypothetical protein
MHQKGGIRRLLASLIIIIMKQYWGFQGLYHLTHILSFAFSLFFREYLVLFPGPVSEHNPPMSASQIGRITGMNFHAQFLSLHGIPPTSS